MTMTPSAKVALTPDGIHVSPLDERQYKHLQLRNGLRALVVSDRETQSASAAMDVHVGYHCDPEDVPGLAHFCEHMLFLGTRKYPDENSYSAFLTAHGGSSNAFTSARNTNYFFDVATPHLHEALDRFAQFFLAPLFTIDATDREMHAVDSENKNYLQEDYWRINQVHRSLGNPAHPFHKFGVGNLESLRDLPKHQGIDVRQALLQYYETYYSANLMRLVVYGKEDVETLSQWVTDIFSDIRNNGSHGPPDFSHASPFTDSQLGRRLDVLPVKDLKMIAVTWLLPPLRGPRYTQQQTSVISHLIGHEGEASLLSLLKNNNWVTTVSAGIEEEHAEFALFAVNFDATEEGIEHVDEIVAALFQYLKLLHESVPLEEWVFQELEDLAVMHFLFQSKQAPINFTSAVAANMQSFAPRDILSQDTLFYPHDNAQIAELLELMTPQRMKLVVVCKSLEPHVDQTERWYGAKYRDCAISAEQLARWSAPGLHDELALPKPNEFVASDFSLIQSDDAAASLLAPPRRIRDDAWCRVWYKPDTHFKKPRTHAAFTFYSPFVADSPLSSVLSDLLVTCVLDELTEYVYDASLAGMHFDLAVQGHNLHLGAVGFSAKLPVLVRRVVEMLSGISESLSDEVFDRMYKQARRFYDNMKLDDAYRLAMNETAGIMHDAAWTLDELVDAIDQINGDTSLLRRHAARVLQQVYVEALIYGNLHASDALVLAEDVLSRLPAARRHVLTSQHYKWLPRQLQLPVGVESVRRRVHPNADNLNCALDYIFQIGPETMRDRVALAVFSQLVSEPLFNQLRTQEQLGYTVFSTPSRQSGMQWFRVIIQSNVAAPEYLEQRLEAFLRDMRRFIAHEMTQEQLAKYIQTIVKEYTEKPKSQEEEVQALSVEIAIREYQFDRRTRLAQLVATVQRSDVLAFFDKYIAEAAPERKVLSVRVYGKAFPLPSLAATRKEDAAFGMETSTALAATLSLLPSGAEQEKTKRELEITDVHAFKQKQPFYGLPSTPHCES